MNHGQAPQENLHNLTILSHHKCATNWLRAICKILLQEGLISLDVVGGARQAPESSSAHNAPLVHLNVNAGKAALEHFLSDSTCNIHFVRDPRDALISNYFSWRYSHHTTNREIFDFRAIADSISIEEGMIKLVEFFPMNRQLTGWTEEMWSSVTQVRYEDMLTNFPDTFNLIFMPVNTGWSDTDVNLIKQKTSFSKMSKRKDGSEDPTSHFRKGKSGDWHNYFSDRLSDAFYTKCDWLGKRLGYWE